MPKDRRRVGWIYVILIYICITAVIGGWCLSFDSARLRDQLISIIPWFLEINFLLIIISIALNVGAVKKLLRDISLRQWYLVLAVVVAGIIMAVFVAPRVHRLFYDENIYLNIGQTIAAQKKAAMCAEGHNNYGNYHCVQLEHNKQPYAFPHVISIVYRIFGASEIAGFLFNNLIFGLSIFISFVLGSLLFDRFSAGIYSALIYCLIPENIIWANTTAVEPSAALFSGMVVAAGLIYLKGKSAKALFLFSVLLSYSIQFRTESLLILPVAGLLFLLYDKNALKDKRTYLFLAFAFALVTPHIVHLYAVRGENWGSPGPRIGITYFFNNFISNSLFYLRNVKFPLLYSLLFGVGISLKGRYKERIVLITWFLLFWGIFLFFYAGSYEFGQDVRFSLVSYMPLSLLAGLGLVKFEQLFERKGLSGILRAITITIILVSFTGFLPLVRTIGEEACQARADHRYAQEMAALLPENSMILTHNPNMFLLWGKNAAQAAIATNNEPLIDHFFQRYTGGVYFHYNYWCNVNNPREQVFCRKILDKYEHTPVVEYTERGYTFVLYRLNRKLPSVKDGIERSTKIDNSTNQSCKLFDH